ncbi:MAG: Ada metal-binding domain-containing protein [Candidatus Saccharimonadaceae bacterium]
MISHSDISDTNLRSNIRNKNIRFGGNKEKKVYGLLSCASGQRLKKENRVFFTSKQEALQNNYRPCGHCLKNDYRKWKNGLI